MTRTEYDNIIHLIAELRAHGTYDRDEMLAAVLYWTRIYLERPV